MATEGTKYQVNFKTADGTLINLYASTVTELESGLADLAMNAMNIKATALELGGASAPAPAPTAESIAQQFNATPVAPTSNNACRHGAMVYKEGTNAQGKGWKAWMCAAPKGAADKCDPIWVR